MGDILIELMNEYGKNLEYLPEGFDNEAYLKSKTIDLDTDI